jgi:hypothetical protein
MCCNKTVWRDERRCIQQPGFDPTGRIRDPPGPNNPAACTRYESVGHGGEWVEFGKWNSPSPKCERAPFARDNHLGNSIPKAHESGAPFAETAADFQFLLHAASLLPEDASLALCKAVAAGRGGSTVALQRAEGLLREYAGMPPLEQKKKGRKGS